MADAFISYASVNQPTALEICNHLEVAGRTCWIAPRDIRPGADYRQEILRGLTDATVLLLVYSKEAAASPHVVREVSLADEEGKTVVPVRIDDTPETGPLRYVLHGKHWVDFHHGPATAVQQIAHAISQSRGFSVPPPSNSGYPPPTAQPRFGAMPGAPWTHGTAAAVPLDPSLPDHGARFAANFIDGLILVVGWFALLVVAALIIVPLEGPMPGNEASPALTGFMVLTSLLVPGLYYAVFETSSMRATPGKAAFGLVVVQDTGEPIGFVRSYIRGTLKFFLMAACYGLLAITALGDDRRRGPWGMLTSTRVINKKG
ncbi:MAG: TIR domain-containing protein [Myxococcota bacterium]